MQVCSFVIEKYTFVDYFCATEIKLKQNNFKNEMHKRILMLKRLFEKNKQLEIVTNRGKRHINKEQ